MHKLAPDEGFSTLADHLAVRVSLAKTVVYEADSGTKCYHLQIGGTSIAAKREDTSKIHSYKWRGSYFKMHQAMVGGHSGNFVAASAGNHAQGVALAAAKLNVNAVIFMPTTTPTLKQTSTKELGGKFVEIVLFGDCFDDAATAARDYAEKKEALMVQPFDDPDTIAGQATVGLELMEQAPNTTKVYVPIGGGGLASGIAFAIKRLVQSDHRIQVIGVEVERQNSMQLSIKCSQRVKLDSVDTFCDGTAVRQPGRYTFELCNQLLDDIVVVSNENVCSAIQTAWETGRFAPEPSGAIALAAAIQNLENDVDENVAVIITGGNMDFRTFPRVVRKSNPKLIGRRYFRFEIAESNGSLIKLLDQFMTDLNIVDFQYGKTDDEVAAPVLGVEGPAEQLDQLVAATGRLKIQTTEISGSSLSDFRVIPFRNDLCNNPLFLKVDFPNRPGSLRDLMRRISSATNICYFNFVESGEMEGHALIGFELLSDDSQYLIQQAMFELGLKFQTTSG